MGLGIASAGLSFIRRSGTRRRHGDWPSELDSLRSYDPNRWRLESPLRVETFGSFSKPEYMHRFEETGAPTPFAR